MVAMNQLYFIKPIDTEQKQTYKFNIGNVSRLKCGY